MVGISAAGLRPSGRSHVAGHARLVDASNRGAGASGVGLLAAIATKLGLPFFGPTIHEPAHALDSLLRVGQPNGVHRTQRRLACFGSSYPGVGAVCHSVWLATSGHNCQRDGVPVTAGPQQIDPYVCIPATTHPWLHSQAFATGYATRAFSQRSRTLQDTIVNAGAQEQ